MSKFAVAGIVQIETIMKVDRIPLDYVPFTSKPNTIFTNVGGDAYNVCAALKALGDQVTFFSMSGRYDYADLLRDDTKWLDQNFVLPILDATPTSLIFYDEMRRQQLFDDIKDIRDAEYPVDLFLKNIQDADCVILANTNFCRPLAKAAKEAGKKVAVNFRAFTEDKLPYNEDFFKIADFVYLSDDNLLANPESFIKNLSEIYGSEVIILGQGYKGLTLFSRRDNLFAPYHAVKTNDIVSTVGAGNSLISCFLHCYFKGEDAVKSIKNAQLFASYKIGHMGTSIGFLSEEELAHWYSMVWGS